MKLSAPRLMLVNDVLVSAEPAICVMVEVLPAPVVKAPDDLVDGELDPPMKVRLPPLSVIEAVFSIRLAVTPAELSITKDLPVRP